MRTIIWFIYFWGYLLAVLPKTHRMKSSRRPVKSRSGMQS